VRVDGGGMASGLVRLTKVVIPQVAPEKPLTTGWTDLPLFQTYPAANGAFLFGHHLLLCDQGYGTGQPSSLVLVDSRAPHKATTLLNNFHGRRFNSLNDVVVHSAPGRTHSRDTSHPLIGHRAKGDPYETIWFTDPHYASEQGFKDAPELPAQAYCFDPWTGNIRAVGDQFTKPNGIAFDATGTTCYITDTGMIRGDGVINGHLPGSM
jgi:gluconolactonase